MAQFFSNPVISILVLIGILIFVHELGHYLVGKYFGFGIETFSIGFGPKLFGFQRGETTYQISLLPLGGYVKFVGAFPGEVIPKEFQGRELANFAVWKRALMTFAGPFANLLLAFLVFTAAGIHGIDHPTSKLGHVRPQSPAHIAGLLPGDKIIQVDSSPVNHWDDLLVNVSEKHEKPIEVLILRDGEQKKVVMQPESKHDEDINGAKVKVGRIGVSPIVLPRFVAIEPESLADKAGLRSGDEILNIEQVSSSQEGQLSKIEVSDWNSLLMGVSKALSQGGELGFEVRNGPESRVVKMFIDPSAMESSLEGSTLGRNDLSHFERGRLVMSYLGVKDGSLLVDETTEGSGLAVGDYILTFNSVPIADMFDLGEKTIVNSTPVVPMELLRQGKKITTDVKLKATELQKAKGREVVYILPGKIKGGTSSDERVKESYTGFASLEYGVKRTFQATGAIFGSLVGLFTGKVPLQALGGPMLIAKAAKDSAEAGIFVYLTTMAMISINLFLINLFPIPVLDGGHLVMQSIEAIRRKPLSIAAMENYQKIGFAFVLALVVLSTYNDIGRFWGSFLKGAP
jgi:regulator of sigma E protease